ncbi:DUF732 domain-containing protein [Mycolicibacterium neoaurum]|uniref:DUF732 domain-containing protein n=1 Tax=Mycolicibacterium neoaurum TaxID=1795 RepID=UPI00248BB273|nr:DUF732 domain-containing protein [Mycolicibacterium neoaurum]WBP96908.1 DUF732 domain-containing protein [Mycolicibacterium neoaurum]WBS05943.1 DUF732 domain-containing protein [Mycolicibacterium neoaurum]
MKNRCGAAVSAVLTVVSIGWATPAHADVDTDFANTLHGFGIYGQRDYNAWLAKIACRRLSTGVDADASESAVFLARNLARTVNTGQVWQFLGTAVSLYCPQHNAALAEMSGDHR